MKQINITYPRTLIFGNRALNQFEEDFAAKGYKRMFLLTIPELMPALKETIQRMQSKGVVIESDDSITKEPGFSDFEAVLQKAREFGADSVVGIGGGSALDTAKLVAAQLKNPQSTQEVKGIGNLKERKTFLACIPTTSGTGSEVSPNALFVDENGQKIGVISPHLVPDAAYIDPQLTVSLPPALTAATGIDALTHCLEAYTNKFAHPFVDLYALDGVRLINKYLLRACKNGDDLEARTQVALGSLYGGMCLGPVNTAAVHALAYPLGVQYGIPHGLSNALLLPYVMEFNIETDPGKYVAVAEALGATPKTSPKETALEGVKIIRNLIKDCGLPDSLEEVGVKENSLKELAAGAMQVKRLLKNNVREMTAEDAENLYKAAY